MMKKIRATFLAFVFALGSITVFAPAADAVICHDYPGGCCDSTVARKLGIRC